MNHYEMPELFELGAAETLTLTQSSGCCSDCCGCKKCADAALEASFDE
jgi:hypothetical protein